MDGSPVTVWSLPVAEVLRQLQSSKEGLTSEDARQRLMHFGANRLKRKKRSDALSLLLSQFKSHLGFFGSLG
jgi:Mg2+-importing ATPase